MIKNVTLVLDLIINKNLSHCYWGFVMTQLFDILQSIFQPLFFNQYPLVSPLHGKSCFHFIDSLWKLLYKYTTSNLFVAQVSVF